MIVHAMSMGLGSRTFLLRNGHERNPLYKNVDLYVKNEEEAIKLCLCMKYVLFSPHYCHHRYRHHHHRRRLEYYLSMICWILTTIRGICPTP